MRPIDADAFKKYIDAQEGRPFIGCTVGEAMKILIDEQPPAQPEPQWIPVSERLPKTGVEVLTYDEALNYIEIQTVSDGRWENQRGDWQDLDDIAAWMPLPTPYTK